MAWSRDPRKPTPYQRGSKRYNDTGGHSPPGDEVENTRDHERIWFELKRSRSCCECTDPGFKYCFDTFDYPNYICDGDFPGGDTMVGYWPGKIVDIGVTDAIDAGCAGTDLANTGLDEADATFLKGSWRNGPYFQMGSTAGYQLQSAGFNWANFFPNYDRTFEAWIKPSSADLSGGERFISHGQAGNTLEHGGLDVYFHADGSLGFKHTEIEDGVEQVSNPGWWEPDAWHHFVLVRNAETNSIAFFINGRLCISRVLASTGWDVIEFPSTPDFDIHHGSWCDIAYYTSALSPKVIKQHYNAVYGVEGAANPLTDAEVPILDPVTVITESIRIEQIDGNGAGSVGGVAISQGDFTDFVLPEDTPFELKAHKGVADGYAPLGSDVVVAPGYLGNLGTPSKLTYLRGDKRWVPGVIVDQATAIGQILVAGGGGLPDYYAARVLELAPRNYFKMTDAGSPPTTIADIGAVPKTMTSQGNPAANSGVPLLFTGETSLRCDGTGDYWSGSSRFGASGQLDQWAFQCWLYLEEIPAAEKDIFACAKGGAYDFGLAITAAGKLRSYNTYISGWSLTGTTTIPLNTWVHVAMEKKGSSGGAVQIWLNGVSEGTTTGNYFLTSGGTARIGEAGLKAKLGHVALWTDQGSGGLVSGWAAELFALRNLRWNAYDPATWGLVTGIEVDKNDADVTAAPRQRINFVEGANVTLTVTDDPTNGEVDVTIASTDTNTVGIEVDKNESDVTAARRSRLNFNEGANISLTITDDSGNDEVDITIAATAPAGSGIEVDKNDSDVTAAPRGRLNFVEGSNITLTISDDAANDEVDITIASSGGGGGGSNDVSTIIHMEVFA